jgi:peptidoglycan/LPS O-acetylase OafA/YrhL
MMAYVPCFVSEVLCYALRDRQRKVLPATLWPWMITGLISGYCLWHDWGGYAEPVYWIGWILCVVLGLTINAFQDSRNRLANVLAHKLALYSYGLYLLHVPVLYLVFDVMKMRGVVAACVTYFGLTLLLAVAIYKTLEKPMIEMGRLLSEGRLAVGATPKVYGPGV